MKKITFLISLLFIANFIVTAQTQRGSFLLGGRAAFPERKRISKTLQEQIRYGKRLCAFQKT